MVSSLESERAALTAQLATLQTQHAAVCARVAEAEEQLRCEREAAVTLKHEFEIRERDIVGRNTTSVATQELALSAARAEAAMILQVKQAKEHELVMAQVCARACVCALLLCVCVCVCPCGVCVGD